MTTGEKIRARRTEMKMTAEELGNRVGVDKSTIGRFEEGKIEKIDFRIFFKIAYALEMNPYDLASEEDLDFIDGITDAMPEITMIARGGRRMPPEKRRALWQMAQIAFPEYFDFSDGGTGND